MSDYISREAAVTIADYAADEYPYDKDPKKPETYSEYNQGWHVLARLVEYEDTGLTPEQCENAKVIIKSAFDVSSLKAERIRELLKADRDGRLVVLPCNVGDVVYGFHGKKTILPMVAKWIETNTDGWCIAAQYVPMAPRFYRFSDFGKTVFLTREEAEKALEAMKNG